ncbi:Sperm protamine like [Actinidia chinensis var. chinensis]|uniref:Sperm protamine like n=1 Tax=Actinidia chinensis var. chinensis TaxID=1590841 RepID=A0A2R6PDE9_ACTCC|nr:Sperm protamine like [Actinidia chinensis var. chinensis]
MVMLCFVLDLRSLSPPLLRDLKQSLLQLANFYAVSAPIGQRSCSKFLSDRIGLCYILKDRISCLDELKVAYTPRGNFNLRDFHHAVNNLPNDVFLPELNDSGALSYCDMKLTSILGNVILYSCGGHEKDVARKVILISSCVVKNLDSVMKEALMDAADNCISVEFLFLEQQSSHLGDLSENISKFVKHISDLENCSFHAYLPDAQVLCGLIKGWLQELKDDMDEPFQARLIFNNNIFGSLNLISCSLSLSANHIIDEFSPCQTCRCHGIPLDDAFGKQNKLSSSCPVEGNDLETCDVIETSVKVGEHTVLFLPSFQHCMKLQQVSMPVDLNVIERINLGSLSEGLLLGTSFFVTPSAFQESDEIDKSELNTHIFLGLCSALHTLDQGLVCSSKCNIETMKEVLFLCYYILLPSEKGLMLLRRLAGSEEVLHFPDVSQSMGSSATIEIENSIQALLLKMEVRDYNPFLHERGFHQKLTLLVKESLQFGSVCPNLKDMMSPNSTRHDFSEDAILSKPTANVVGIEEEIPELNLTVGEESEDTAAACITEEWEQMIINETPKISSPSFMSKPKFDQLVLSPQDGCRQLDEKTSRILERLEVPRELKRKASFLKSSSIGADSCVPTKAPLIPFQANRGLDQVAMSSQPMKPNFQKLKRKQR